MFKGIVPTLRSLQHLKKHTRILDIHVHVSTKKKKIIHGSLTGVDLKTTTHQAGVHTSKLPLLPIHVLKNVSNVFLFNYHLLTTKYKCDIDMLKYSRDLLIQYPHLSY